MVQMANREMVHTPLHARPPGPGRKDLTGDVSKNCYCHLGNILPVIHFILSLVCQGWCKPETPGVCAKMVRVTKVAATDIFYIPTTCISTYRLASGRNVVVHHGPVILCLVLWMILLPRVRNYISRAG